LADFFNPQSAKQIMINWTGINHIHFLLWQVRPSSTLPPKKKDGFMETQTNNRKTISKKTRFEVFKRDKFTCQFCGNEAPNVILEIDHLKPVINLENKNYGKL
jgi:5-methylcytosine-specific restriction endonuclease McrA